MKTFATNGTGNQQTLVELESEKIPVYEDLADAESDLANLAENQIIATHDTGSELSAPVDVVQSGNMHAVTSNAVAKSLSYSTTEQATGGKWIDGKPIYRRVIEITNPAYDWTPIDLTNLFPNIAKGFLGKLCRITRQDGSIICQNGFYFADTDRCEFIIAEYTNNLRICCFLKSTAQITKIEFEVEYTKTTD